MYIDVIVIDECNVIEYLICLLDFSSLKKSFMPPQFFSFYAMNDLIDIFCTQSENEKQEHIFPD